MNPTEAPVMPETTDTTHTRTEYGLRASHGGLHWPDGDGDVYVPGDGYYPASGESADIREALVDAVARYNATASDPVELVERKVTETRTAPVVVTPSFPTEPGAMIEAEYRARGGIVKTGFFVRSAFGTGGPYWLRLTGDEVEAAPIPAERDLTLKRVISEKGPQ